MSKINWRVKVRRAIFVALLRALPEPVAWRAWLSIAKVLPAIALVVTIYIPFVENNEPTAVIAEYWRAVSVDGDCANDWLTRMTPTDADAQYALCKSRSAVK